MAASEPVALSIVIPAYNEAQRLPATLAALLPQLRRLDLASELVLSDDGSTDGTAACFRDATAGVATQVVRTEPNRGKGHAVRVGMLAAHGALRLMCDADGSMPASELPKLIAPLQHGEAEVVIGSRYLGGGRAEGQPGWRRAWSRLTHAVVKRTLVPDIEDTHCGYKGFTAAAAQAIFERSTIDGWVFDLEALALAQRLGYRVREVAVVWHDDGRSRVRGIREFPRVLREALRLRANFRGGVYRLPREVHR